MEKQKYLEMRNSLYNEAEQLINEGKIEEGNAKMQEITDLDNRFENEAKALANLNAMKDKAAVADLSNNSVAVQGAKVVEGINNKDEQNDFTNSIEYRKAFMNYAVNGTPIPAEFKNANANTTTGDVGAVIPETVLTKIVEKMEATGMILPLITRTSYKGGVKIPTSTVKPTATWVSEGAGSDKQKKSTAYISFGYNKLRCAVSMSLEVSTMALAFFETTFINNVTEAMVKALEKSIIDGDGAGKPNGILSETVVTGQNINIAKTADPAYKNLVDAEAALPLPYENGAVWFMTKKTFMEYAGLTDSVGQPIGRVNYGIDGKLERTLLGRTVVCNDYMSNYAATVATDTVVAFLFNPKDYVLNTNLNMTIKRYEDNETDDMVTKAIMLVDGKVIDKNSLVTITKKSS